MHTPVWAVIHSSSRPFKQFKFWRTGFPHVFAVASELLNGLGNAFQRSLYVVLLAVKKA